jgi:glycosyltransferase involved in cell wall biosynthesis
MRISATRGNEMKIRLLYLISDLHVGGACSLMINNAVELAKRGHHIQIVYFGSNDALLPRIYEHNLKVMRMPYDGGILGFFRVCRSLISFVRSNNIDIIHGNLHLDIRFGFVTSMLTGRPWVVTLHALRFAAMSYGSFKYRMLRRLEDVLLIQTTRLIAVSEAVKADQKRMLRARSTVIFSGVPKLPAVNTQVHSENHISILHVGRIDPVKNQMFSLQVARALKNAGMSFALKIVGFGEGSYIRMLKLKLKEFGIEQEVEFAGIAHNVGDYYKSTRFVLVPSHSESFGLVVAEAMQFGRVVVAANVPGLNELMVHGEDGFYFEPGNVDQAVQIIIGLQQDKIAFQKISENSERTFLKKFTIEKSVSTLVDFYLTLLAEREAGFIR